MALSNANIVVGGTGTVSAAPVGTAAPTTTSGALNGSFVDLGYLTEDGFTFTEGKDITDVNVWQSFYPARRMITGRSAQVAFSLREWKKDTIQFALGGTVSGTTPNFTYTPPSPSALVTKSLVIDWSDTNTNGVAVYFRLYFPVGIVSENVETNLTRTDSAVLPVTFSGMDPGNGVVYQLFTSDPSFS